MGSEIMETERKTGRMSPNIVFYDRYFIESLELTG